MSVIVNVKIKEVMFVEEVKDTAVKIKIHVILTLE